MTEGVVYQNEVDVYQKALDRRDICLNSINALEGLLRHDPGREDVIDKLKHLRMAVSLYEGVIRMHDNLQTKKE